MPRIAFARLWFEANSFAPHPTPLAAFRSREWVSGEEARGLYRGTATELGGLDAFLRERPGWEAVILRCASAQPGGVMTSEAFSVWWEEVAEGLARGGFDGVFLSLHGACITEDDPEADLTVVRLVRGIVGPSVPVVASFDMHGNLSPRIVGLLDGASAYRTYPHVDMADAAWRALRLLEMRLGGRRLFGALVKLPRVLHSFHMRSESGPMAEVWAAAAALESAAVPEVSVLGGFAWGDTPSAGPSVMVWAENAAVARAGARQVMGELAERVGRFAVSLPSPEEGLARALAGPAGLVALLDPADNPLSGGAADTPGVLRLLLEAGPEVETVLAFLHDPGAVEQCWEAGLGGAFVGVLGGRSCADFGAPVPFAGVVEALTPGRFLNHGPMEAGSPVDLGRTAMVRAGKLRVILTSAKEAAVDPGFFALHGVDFAGVRLLVNKAKNHFRAAFAQRCSLIVEADFPGPAALDLGALPFRHVPLAWRV